MIRSQIGVQIVLFLCYSASLVDAAEPLRSIHVRGEGTASSPPDMATIELGVSTMASSAAEALKANNQAMHQLMVVLKDHGVASKDIQTSQFNVGPEYVAKNQTMELAGYRVSNQVQVHVRDLPHLGKLLDAMVTSGSNQVSGVRFGIDDERGVLDQARNRAMQEARRRAELYATAAGVKVGKVLSIEEQPTASPGPVMVRAMMRESADSVPIASGEQTMQTMVDVRYELID